jgi:hypothetical protein
MHVNELIFNRVSGVLLASYGLVAAVVIILKYVDVESFLLSIGKLVWLVVNVIGTILFTKGDDLYSAPQWVVTVGNIAFYGSILFLCIYVLTSIFRK